MSKKVLRVAKNIQGRDFIMGDVHGAFGLVLQGMQKVKFNAARDRLFVPGDLIDRGSESHRCVKFLGQPYVFAVPGNHEKMFMDMYDEEKSPEDIQTFIEVLAGMNFNGMGWLASTTENFRQEMLAAFRKLPLAIELETERGLVGIVHADVPQGMHWNDFVRKLEAGDKTVTEFALGMVDESRDRILRGRQDGVPGIGRVFVGHTPQFGGVRRFGNVYAIDTGACFGEAGKTPGAHLSMVNACMKTEVLSAARDPADTSLVDVRLPNTVSTTLFSSLEDIALLG